MTNEEARQLLIKAGVPEERINQAAIDLASVVGDAIRKACAEKIAEIFVAKVLQQIEGDSL